MSKIRPPIELIIEIPDILPLNVKWADFRVSLIFDIFVLKNQQKWVINYKKFVTTLTDGKQKMHELQFNKLGRMKSPAKIQALSDQLFLVWASSMFVPMAISDPNFKQAFFLFVDRFRDVKFYEGVEGLRSTVSVILQCVEDLYDFLVNSIDVIANNIGQEIIEAERVRIQSSLEKLNQYL